MPPIDIFSSVFPSRIRNHTTATPLASPNIGFDAAGQTFGRASSATAGNGPDPAYPQVQRSLKWSVATRFLSLEGKTIPDAAEWNQHGDSPGAPPDVRDAIKFLIDNRTPGSDIVEWFMVEILVHFSKNAVPRVRELWAEAVEPHTALEVLTETSSFLQSALFLYDGEFRKHIHSCMTNGIRKLPEARQAAATRAAVREEEKFRRLMQDMFLESLPTTRVERVMIYVMYQYVFKVFCTDDKDRSKVADRDATDKFLELLQGLKAAGLGDELAQGAFATAMNKLIPAFVSSPKAKVDWITRQSIVPALKTWILVGVTPVVMAVMTILDYDVRVTPPVVHQWQHTAMERLGEERAKHLLDLVIRWPDSIGAIHDLKEYLMVTAARAHICATFEQQVQTRLLNHGVSTSHILDVYIYTIEAFSELDPKGVLLERVARPIRHYLRGREDTAKTIVGSLLADIDPAKRPSPYSLLSQEIAKQMLRPISSFKDSGQPVDWDDPDWMPDPMDAEPESAELSIDIIAHLFSLYEKEEFIAALRTILGEHLLKIEPNATLEKETRLLELFKFHLGDDKMQACEVMLRDVDTSRRMNTAIRRSDLYHGTMHNAQLDATILSQFFWPSLREDQFAIPTPIAALQEQYAKAFAGLKDMRRLEWLPAVGKVDVELEFEDRKVTESVTPWVASVIYAFNSSEDGGGDAVTRTVEQLQDELKMAKPVVLSALRHWVKAHALRETAAGSDTYVVIEKLPTTVEAAPRSMPAAPPENDAESAVKTQELQFSEKAELYKTFILGMLTNQGAMPATKIQMMLKMVFPGGFPFPDEMLKTLLGDMVEEEKVTRQHGDIFTLNKGD